MSRTFIEELRRENLCTHFILPLLHLSKFSFIASNFVNCYLMEEDKIAVAVSEYLVVPNQVISMDEHQGIYKDAGGTYYLVYRIPDMWRADLELFRQGRFSKMSQRAKESIRQFSKLNFRVTNKHGEVVTDLRLQALERNQGLKEMWEREIECDPLDDMELMSIPDKRSYIDLNGLIREG